MWVLIDTSAHNSPKAWKILSWWIAANKDYENVLIVINGMDGMYCKMNDSEVDLMCDVKMKDKNIYNCTFKIMNFDIMTHMKWEGFATSPKGKMVIHILGNSIKY